MKIPSAAESCLARKLASFGMVSSRHYTPGRMQSEDQTSSSSFRYRVDRAEYLIGKSAESGPFKFYI